MIESVENMIKFNVNLTENDIKKFIVYRMNLKSKDTIAPFITYILAIIVIIIANIFADLGIAGWLVVAFLLLLLCFRIYKIYSIYQKILVKNLDIVNKEREVFIDQRSLSIMCDTNENFCGKYSIYDLQHYDKTSEYYYLTFHNKAYIIIPRRCLETSQDEELLTILKNKS